jgi:hypothetical protein
MPSIGSGCHELRIDDVSGAWRIVYKIAPEAIVILEFFTRPQDRRRVGLSRLANGPCAGTKGSRERAYDECCKKEETSDGWLGGRHHPRLLEPL